MAFPIIKLPLESNCQDLVFRIDIKYSRTYIFGFPGKVFLIWRNNRKDFQVESAETRLLLVEITEEITLLQKIKDFVKN